MVPGMRQVVAVHLRSNWPTKSIGPETFSESLLKLKRVPSTVTVPPLAEPVAAAARGFVAVTDQRPLSALIAGAEVAVKGGAAAEGDTAIEAEAAGLAACVVVGTA